MHDMIKEIVAKNAIDLATKKQKNPRSSLEEQIKIPGVTRDFYQRLQTDADKHGVSLIAEIKFSSPTEKHLGDKKDILPRAKLYEKAGASAISLITEPHFFTGDVKTISQVKQVVSLPVLQKDFVVDSYQIYEAAAYGADALLLIAKLVNKSLLKTFVDLCITIGIEPVVEINDEEDLAKALGTKTRIIAVNARDLDTFTVDVAKACELLEKIPAHIFKLGFSGIHTASDVKRYKHAGAKTVLVGTTLMKAENIEKTIQEFLYES